MKWVVICHCFGLRSASKCYKYLIFIAIRIMESTTLPLTKEQFGQIINQQLNTINSLVNERIWLREQLSMYHDTTFQWQQYSQSLEMDLQRTKKEQVKIEEAHSQLDLKYKELRWIYWQVKRKYEKYKTDLSYSMEVGESVCAEYLYYKQSSTELLEHYRQLWSACYATSAGSGQEQERSDHGTPQKSTAVLPLNLKSRKMRSSPSKGEVPPLAFTYIMSFKDDNVHQSGIALQTWSGCRQRNDPFVSKPICFVFTRTEAKSCGRVAKST